MGRFVTPIGRFAPLLLRPFLVPRNGLRARERSSLGALRAHTGLRPGWPTASVQSSTVNGAKNGRNIIKIGKKIWKNRNTGQSPALKGLNLCFNIMNVKLCLLNQELDKVLREIIEI